MKKKVHQFERKEDFLKEILDKVSSQSIPVMVGGDFNLIRHAEEKSNGHVNRRWMEKFNKFIADAELRELHRVGCKFTWTNKQVNPICEVLDRVLVSPNWDSLFPYAVVKTLTRVGSDHNPIMVLLERQGHIQTQRVFRFDRAWLTQDGFKEWVIKHGPERRKDKILDHWKCQGTVLRRKMRGWSMNNISNLRRTKEKLLSQIQKIDTEADMRQLNSDEWAQRYQLEDELSKIYLEEEIYWQGRSGEKWLLEGDANTAFFHGIANGRKRKSTILSLEDEGRQIEDPAELKQHIYQYYKNLFGAEVPPKNFLSNDMWTNEGRLTKEESEHITRPFTMVEIEQALKEMKTNTAPGPDGLPVSFYKEFWPQLKNQLKEMTDLLFEGKLDLWRLNYGVITLIPKIKDANNIKAFRPICLLNVCFKFLTKILTKRLTEVAAKVIGQSQTAFIPGRHILDGVVILHEVLHTLKKGHHSGIIFKLDFEKAYDRVQWSFLFEVLQRKGFNEKWVQWIKMATVEGRVAININGEVKDFFKTYRGVRQGDPLSPLLFNLVADALSEMLNRAKEAGHLEGLVPQLVPGGLTHLQYADDTILFLANTEENIATIKFLLYCYEEMSGLKINYQKSEVIVIGGDESDTLRVANLFNCKSGKLPFSYLGIPVSVDKLSATNLNIPAAKIEKRLATWKCGHLSYGGRSILINSCLSSIPMYMMGIYLLPEGVHQKMDSFRARFFWEGLEGKKKYHMIKWEALCRPKDFGGLGFVNTRIMNAALLCKWIFKLETGVENPCCDLLRRKYMVEGGGFFQSKVEGGSQFWRGLHEVKGWMKLGSSYKLGDGKNISFWDDIWLGETPLKTQFPYIFSVCADDNKTTHQMYVEGEWKISLRRTLGEGELEEWGQLHALLQNIELNSGKDSMCWNLNKTGMFSTKSLYREISFGGIKDYILQELWRCHIPLKVKVFFWLMLKGKIQTGHQLKKMKWKGSPNCKLCGEIEDTDHLMFQCALSQFTWCCFRDAFGWDGIPKSRAELLNKLSGQSGDSIPVLLSLFAAAAWSIWLLRNDWVFNNKMIVDASHLPHKIVSLHLQWRSLAPVKKRSALDTLRGLLLASIRKIGGSNT